LVFSIINNMLRSTLTSFALGT